MNMTMRQRSALVQAAEHKHNQLPRPVLAGEIVMAEYNQKEACPELAQTANRMDWIIVGLWIWIVLIVALSAAAALGAFK